MTVTIEQARKMVADAAEAEGRSSFAQIIRQGRGDDNPAVQKALAGEAVDTAPVPESIVPTPNRVDMGEVPNLLIKS